jgi:hypothetical protein
MSRATENSDEDYDFFISYYSGTGSVFAKYLKEHAKHFGRNAFLDNENIHKDVKEETDEWRSQIDQAIKKSKNFVLIMTLGFRERHEIKRELEKAFDNKINVLFFKKEDLDKQELIMRIDNKTTDFSKYEYTPFTNECDLLEKVEETLRGKPARLTPIDQHALLPDNTQITNVNMDNSLFDEIYERAQREAIGIYHDAQLSYFTIQVYPYQKLNNIYLTFYSKWADKTCNFVSDNCNRQARHSPPDKRPVVNSEERGFTTLPWKKSPQWQKFIERAYAKIEPLTPARNTGYHLSAYISHDGLVWRLNFEDGFSGREHAFKWNGKGFDEGSIVQLS